MQEENIVRLTTTIDEINAASDPAYYRLLKFYILASMLMFIFSLLIGEYMLTENSHYLRIFSFLRKSERSLM